ncbi:MAG: metalloregulator ArsR/SmtB family transcription factor [Clostridia bacterium]|nr:metalloregulator ArsR/SmtB family transcription factor [Clostridia bacterium]
MSLCMAGKQKRLLENKAEILKAMAHPVRLCIVRNLIEIGGCNVSSMQSCLLQPQSTISQHLSKLKAAGIISGKRKGTEITYTVINDEAKNLANLLIPDASAAV